jgi:hypothetical protein
MAGRLKLRRWKVKMPRLEGGWKGTFWLEASWKPAGRWLEGPNFGFAERNFGFPEGKKETILIR